MSVVALVLSTGIIAACAFFYGLIAVAVSEGVEDRPPDFLGLAQRLFLALLFVWMIVVGRHLTRAPRAVLSVVLIAGLLGVGQPVCAQSTIPLYSGVAPGSGGGRFPETLVNFGEPIGPVITNVSQPTLTVFRPNLATDTKPAVIVAPGGAFHFVTMEAEGTIGDWRQVASLGPHARKKSHPVRH